MGGLSRAKNYGSSKKPYPSVKSKDFAGGGRSYPIPTKADAIDALRLAGLHGRSDVRAKVYRKYPELRKELGGYLLPKYWPGGKLPENSQSTGGEMVPQQSGFQNFTKGAGVVGSIIQVGDQIATPIRQGADATNQGGGLVNMNKSANAATAGAFFDPFRTGMSTIREGSREEKQEYWKGLGKSLLGVPFLAGKGFGKARAERLDKEGEEAYRNAAFGTINQNYMGVLNNQLRGFALGGSMNNGTGIVDYKGASHSNGGIKVDSNGNPASVTKKQAIAEVEGGEVSWSGYVFSNKLSYGKKK